MRRPDNITPKIRCIGSVTPDPYDRVYAAGTQVEFIPTNSGAITTRVIYLRDFGDKEPYRCGETWPNVWIYKRKAFRIDDDAGYTADELAVRIKHMVLKREREQERIKAEMAALMNREQIALAKREHIPDAVRMFVWQRDKGQCTRCDSKERLEFDHIIPLAEGGSSTERNIQLLCETCNRSKGKRIG
jgi:hypothetical protein